jgi:hypothetical protein
MSLANCSKVDLRPNGGGMPLPSDMRPVARAASTLIEGQIAAALARLVRMGKPDWVYLFACMGWWTL